MKENKYLILLLKISMDIRNEFFKIYRQLRHAVSKSLARPGIDCGRISYWLKIHKNLALDCLKHSAKKMCEEVEEGVNPRILNLDTKRRELSANLPLSTH